MHPSPLHNRRQPNRGVALIIVLAFVVLLTGLILAFFSRALSERQISNSSAAQVKVDLFTQGAVATIIGDLQQEIAAGSNATYYTNANAGGAALASVYLPANPATAVPALALQGKQNTVTTFPANLIKRSAYGQNFFPANGDAGAANYNNNINTVATVSEPSAAGSTPSPAVAPAQPASNRAASITSSTNGLSTTIVSQNGRAISATRWNKGLLLPRANPTSATDVTPYFVDPSNSSYSPGASPTPAPAPNKTEFVPPDWVLVARDGSNPGSTVTPATFGSTGTAINNPSLSNTSYVTGRYAYAIYDEGGLLDANVAGYPTASNTYPTTSVAGLPPVPTEKPFLSYADLTVKVPSDAAAPGGGTQPLLTGAQVNTLVGWRNNASAQSSGVFPTYSPQPTPGSSPKLTPFDQAVLYNTNGFMAIGTDPAYYKLNLTSGQSDKMFGSRQELINFFTQGLKGTSTDPTVLAALQNSLQYFGAFSRGLNQPSYAPVSRVMTASNPNPRPLIQPSAASGGQPGGGNNVGDNYTNTTAVKQDIFSPSLLNVRVETNVTANPMANQGRSDGTNLVVGEPLVKNRFALQRLAWITYNGPSQSNLSDPNVQALITTYGISQAYLQLGTAQNIKNYFGLTWNASKRVWSYNAHNGGSATNVGTGSGAIMKLSDIADQKMRDPDFFELLKASVDPGALGKAGTNAPQAEGTEPSSTAHFQPLNYQFFNDVSVDAAIIQLGADIIDQYDLDGYPTRIVFNDGSGAREFRGVENLPYIYRLRTAGLKVRDAKSNGSTPSVTSDGYAAPFLHSGTQAGYTAVSLLDTGAGIVLTEPDIWNPHDQNSSLGNPRPGKGGVIRLVANSAPPDTLYLDAASNIPINSPTDGYSTYTSGSSGFTGTNHGSFRGSSSSTTVTKGAAPPNPSAKPPIPYFTRGLNQTGTLSDTNLIMSGNNGGFNYAHKINITNATYLTFNVPDATYFREPTMLAEPDASGSGLAMVVDPTDKDLVNLQNDTGANVLNTSPVSFKSINTNPLQSPTTPSSGQGFIGIALGTYPMRWVGPPWSGADSSTLWNYGATFMSSGGSPVYAISYSLQYQDPVSGNWVTYDEKYVDSDLGFVDPNAGTTNQPKGGAYSWADPRTARFGSASENNIADAAHYRAPLIASTPNNWASTWLDTTAGKPPIIVTERPDLSSGFGSNFRGSSAGDWGGYAAPGLHTSNIDTSGGTNKIFLQTGLFAQNDPDFTTPSGTGSDALRFVGDTGIGGPRDGNFWTDPDGVARRAQGAYVKNTITGQPLATATTFSGGVGRPIQSSSPQTPGPSQSRPIILNRPFVTVGELGYVFTGNPWKNVDFSTPESAYSELLDVFCVNDNAPADGLLAGKVNLNTRQQAVIKSILAGAYTDEENSFTPPVTGVATVKPLAYTDADAIATLLVNRTTAKSPTNTYVSGPQPLQNIGDIVGRWNKLQTIPTLLFSTPLGSVHDVDGSKSYDGFSADLSNATNLSSLSTEAMKIPRMRESAMRALSSVGNTRVWNLMIDVIAQSGRYPAAATSTKNFIVEGEQRYWVHVAIDRYTGTVLDTKLELVKE